MTKYEEMLAEYDDNLIIEEHNMENEGLYSDSVIWINKKLMENRKHCILAEEIGHYETSVGNILDTKDMNKCKQEHKARVWAYQKLLDINKVIEAASNGYTEIYDMAEYLNVDEEFLRDYLIWQGIIDISL